MDISILESSLNLRIDKTNHSLMHNSDYVLTSDVAKKQLEYNADIYCNVEYMECQDEEYLFEFSKNGYKRVTALFENNRGILCYVKKELQITNVVHRMQSPHLLHFQVIKDEKLINIIVFRILVSDQSKNDFYNRKLQFNSVMQYIDLIGSSDLIVTGDWNHAYIRDVYDPVQHNQYVFNYQYICSEFEKRDLEMGIKIDPNIPPKESGLHSYKGFLSIDHIAVGKDFEFISPPNYSSYICNAPIGTPDHAYLFSEIRF